MPRNTRIHTLDLRPKSIVCMQLVNSYALSDVLCRVQIIAVVRGSPNTCRTKRTAKTIIWHPYFIIYSQFKICAWKMDKWVRKGIHTSLRILPVEDQQKHRLTLQGISLLLPGWRQRMHLLPFQQVKGSTNDPHPSWFWRWECDSFDFRASALFSIHDFSWLDNIEIARRFPCLPCYLCACETGQANSVTFIAKDFLNISSPIQMRLCPSDKLEICVMIGLILWS